AITEYYQGNLPAAQADFRSLNALNPQFQAPSTFLTLPKFRSIAKNNGTPGPARGTLGTSPVSNGQATELFGLPNWVVYTGLVGGVLLLGLILLLVSITIVRRQRREKKEFEELDRKAEAD